MSAICSICGLPQELCACETIAKEGQKIVVKAVKRKFNSLTTVIEGVDPKSDVKSLVKQLKERLACGGAIKGNTVELMGDHRRKAKEILVAAGFAPDSIEVREQVE